MKAALYILIIAIVQGTLGQLDPNIDQLVQAESMVTTSVPTYVTSSMPDFLSQVEGMFDSVMQQSLQTSNFELICYLNSKQKYEPWYTDIAYKCMCDRNQTLANLTFWHDKFMAAMPEINQLYLDAVAVVNNRPDCGPNDKSNYAMYLGQNITFSAGAFQNLNQILGSLMQVIPVDMLYGFNSELSMIFSFAMGDPNFDAIDALESAEFKHLTIDSLTIETACDYARWYFVANIYAAYTTVLDNAKHLVVDALLRGSSTFTCTGQ